MNQTLSLKYLLKILLQIQFLVAADNFSFLEGHNARPKLRFRRTWPDFSRTMSDYRQLFAALVSCTVQCKEYNAMQT